MKCPSCNDHLKQFKYHGVTVDICTSCSGIWFDPGEMKQHIDFMLKYAENIPNAKIELDKEVATSRNISEPLKSCPICNEAMEKINYGYDSNIIIDRCHTCGGIWTDGAEIHKLAIYTKGNPLLDGLGDAIMEERKQAQELNNLAGLGKNLASGSRFWFLMPKIILPLGDEIKTQIIPIMVFGIVTINIIMFIYQFFVIDDIYGFIKEYGLVPSAISAGKGYFSFISSMFLHGGLLHLFGNMYFFWIFADNVEEKLGHFKFLGFYLLVGILGGITHILTATHPDIPAIGASGAIAGVMGAYFVFYPLAKVKTLFVRIVIDVPAYLYLGGWIVFQIINSLIYLSHKEFSHIGWFIHIGGFASGAILAWLYKRMKK